MRRICKGILYAAVLGTALSAESRLSIRVSTPVVMVGHSLQVVCKVPRAAANRGVTAVLPDYRSMYDQLDGADSRITHSFLFLQVPCGVERAFCILETQGEKPLQVAQPIEVAGCEP